MLRATKGQAVKASKTVHYHHDTKVIADTLTRGHIYDTTKGTGEYVGRSHSNGKLLFKACADGGNIYFTKKEWVANGNSDKRVNKKMMSNAVAQMSKPIKSATSGMVVNKTMFVRISTGSKHVYAGTHYEYGVCLKCVGGSQAKEYFPVDMFKKLFVEIAE